ncbi:MAG: acyltransferase [Pirellulales bacterium]|nr:N-acetyltransferase [Planctomycetales bacterium]
MAEVKQSGESRQLAEVYVHPAALVESETVGAGTRVWAYAHVLRGATLGRNCNVGDHCFIETGAVVGDNVTVKNGVCIWDGVTLADDVFVGPMVCFTNDRSPRSPRMPEVHGRYEEKSNWLSETHVEQGVAIGANATVLPGIRLGRYCVVGAGAVVTRDVAPHSVVVGSPARQIAFTCRCGRVRSATPQLSCRDCDTHLDETTTQYQHAES